jgi:hypothetical protein
VSDKLDDIFAKREIFMCLIKEKFIDTYPDWPIDISQKNAQATVRETALKGVEEMFEALGHLKNWKPHRETEVPEFNRKEFLEEVVDSFNYFFSLLVLLGVDSEEFYEAFNDKDKIIKERIVKGY